MREIFRCLNVHLIKAFIRNSKQANAPKSDYMEKGLAIAKETLGHRESLFRSEGCPYWSPGAVCVQALFFSLFTNDQKRV